MGKAMLVRLASFALVAVCLWVFHAYVIGSLGGVDQRYLMLAILSAVLAVSLNIINGITGQFSIGHAAFYQVGAYTTGYVATTTYNPTAMPDWLWLTLMMILGAVAAGVAGLVVGLPSLRLRGDYLAIVTLGFGEIIRIIVINVEELGGAHGLQIKKEGLGVIQITPVWMALLLLILVIAVSRNLLKSAHGLQFLSVREDELAASAMGVNTTKTKVTAFIIGAAFAGMAGALFSHYEGFIAPKHFSMEISFLILAMVVIGGNGSITGAALAGIVLTLIPEGLRDLPAVPAIALLGFVVSMILVFALNTRLSRKIDLDESQGQRTAFGVVGVIGLAAVLYFCYLAFQQVQVPSVIRFGVVLAGLGIAVAILLAKKRMRTLAGFGYTFALLALMIALTIPLKMGLESVPFIWDNLKSTSYQAANLRMPLFAFLLVMIMLSRPQGLLGHRELSLDSIFRRRREVTA